MAFFQPFPEGLWPFCPLTALRLARIEQLFHTPRALILNKMTYSRADAER